MRYYFVGSLIFPFFSFLISFSQEGTGAIYFSLLISFFSVIFGADFSNLGFGKDVLDSFFVSGDVFLVSSQVRVYFRGASDLSQASRSH